MELLNADLRSKYSLDLSASLQEMESAANNETDRTPLWSADLRAKSSLGLRASMQEMESVAKNETLWNADVRAQNSLGLRASMPEMESAAKDESYLGPSPWPTLKAPMRSPVSMQSQLENPASTQKVMHSPNSAWDIAEFTDRGQLQIKIATESLAKMQAVCSHIGDCTLHSCPFNVFSLTSCHILPHECYIFSFAGPPEHVQE